MSSLQDFRSALSSHAWSPATVVSFPNDTAFEAQTERWTVFAPPTYAAAVSPATEDDLVSSIDIARGHNFPFLATGGRHGYGTTLGNLKDGLAVDMSQLKNIDIDRDAGTLTVGPGVRMGDLPDPVNDAGFQLPIGSCSGPGFIGATLGAGVNRWSGIFGLIIDSLLSVRLLTANGGIVTVNKTIDPELFWGLRGAGFNFGIVLEATYKLQSIQNGTNGGGQLVNVDMLFPAAQVSSYFNVLENFGGTLPEKLAVVSIVHYSEELGGAAILANWVYFGSEAEARQVMAPVLNLQPPVSNVSAISWTQLLKVQAFGVDAALSEKNIIRDAYSTNVRKLSASMFEELFENMSNFYNEYPAGRGSVVELETFPNQAMAAVPDDSTAYPWRDALGNFILLFSWAEGDATTADAVSKFGPQFRDNVVAQSGYDGLSVYVNYAHGDEPLENIYGSKQLPRLTALKEKWDPSNIFAYNNAIPTQ